ncbi:MAG: hypothetical protein PHI63_01910 [Patescibacteria group bacterium]|nr:hypothetical protein [Patescibacteria group bacterium]
MEENPSNPKIFKRNWNALSAIANTCMVIATFGIIYQGYSAARQSENNTRLLNRAYVSISGPGEFKNGESDFKIVNTGKTLAIDLKYSVFYLYNDGVKRFLNQEVPIGVLNPNQISNQKLQLTDDFVKELLSSSSKTFYTQVSYKTYYQECVGFRLPLQYVDNNTLRLQSVEEFPC